MAKLIYSALTSLDGHVADADGNFDWAAPDEELHHFVNDLQRNVGTELLGRRMYEVMVYWETVALQGEPPAIVDFAEIWRATDKVVYSTTLEAVSSTRTRLEREFDPATVRRLKADADRDLSVGGSELAGVAIRAGLVDEYQLFVFQVVVGGGKRCLPDGVRADLILLEERRFANGAVYLRYRTSN